MKNFNFYHLFANGADASNFIASEQDFVYQFNLVGISAHNTKAKVVAFSIEETHPHFLLYGTDDQCLDFKEMYKRSSLRHISSTRGSSDGVNLNLEMYLIEDESYLRNVAAYVIVQPTKDGKPVMFYDYLWGSGSMYFRDKQHRPIWICDPQKRARKISDLDKKSRLYLSGRHILPEDWLVYDNLILPINYVDVPMFESIFRTHNCFRVFTGSSNKQSTHVMAQMSNVRGVELNDYEARELASQLALENYKTRDIRRLDVQSRLNIAFVLRQKYRISARQLAIVCRLPENEIRKYVR